MEKLSYKSLKPHLKNLNFCGCFKLSSDAPKLRRILHTIYMRFVLCLHLIFITQQIIQVYQVRYDADRVMDTMFILLTNSDCVYKQFILWMKSYQIEELLDIMKGPTFNQGVPEHQVYLQKTVRQARVLLRVFNITALSTCLLMTLYPVMLHLQGKPVEFAFWLPFAATKTPHTQMITGGLQQLTFTLTVVMSTFHDYGTIFITVLDLQTNGTCLTLGLQLFVWLYYVAVYMWIQISWIAFNNTTMDAFISFFLAQCKTQLSILRQDLENVVERSKGEAIVSSNSFENILQRRFHYILKHYNDIVMFSEKVQTIFDSALFYQFVMSGWILCTTAYRTVNMSPASVEFISMLMYMSCILTELFLYCFFGNEVYDESEKLVESAYAMDWMSTPLKHRRELIAFMERIKRPIKPTAGKIIELSNRTFVSILKSSYSFYAFLKNSERN